MQKYFDNISGIIYEHSRPVIKFSLKNGTLMEYEILAEKRFLPAEFQLRKNYAALYSFLEGRLVPRARQNIDELLRGMGLDYYDPVGILHYTHGLCTDDYYWIKFGDSDITQYESIKIRE